MNRLQRLLSPRNQSSSLILGKGRRSRLVLVHVSSLISPRHTAKTKGELIYPAVLSRVQAFLPQMEASNAVLAQKVQADPASVDIENIAEGAEQYIEMVRDLDSISRLEAVT